MIFYRLKVKHLFFLRADWMEVTVTFLIYHAWNWESPTSSGEDGKWGRMSTLTIKKETNSYMNRSPF